MHRVDNSKYMLYIEPPVSEKADKPTDDDYIYKMMKKVMSRAKSGAGNYMNEESSGDFRVGVAYKGFHRAEDGKRSSNKDYLLENGMITNSLCLHYLAWYREWIPASEMKKVEDTIAYYEENVYEKN